MANLLKVGMTEIHKQFLELKKGWDGYDAEPIKPKILESIKDMDFICHIIKKFKQVGFQETDIEITPVPNGNIQFEAEGKNMYFEIEVDENYYPLIDTYYN